MKKVKGQRVCVCVSAKTKYERNRNLTNKHTQKVDMNKQKKSTKDCVAAVASNRVNRIKSALVFEGGMTDGWKYARMCGKELKQQKPLTNFQTGSILATANQVETSSKKASQCLWFC